MIVNGEPLDHLNKQKIGLIKPNLNFVKKKQTRLIVGKTLVNPKCGNFLIKIANFSSKPITVYKNTVTGNLKNVTLSKPVPVQNTQLNNKNTLLNTNVV